MAKSAQLDPIEEARIVSKNEPPGGDKPQRGTDAPVKAAAPTTPAVEVPAPPKYKLEMPEKVMVGVGGRMTWVHPGMIVSEMTHTKAFIEGLKQKGITLVEVVEDKAKAAAAKVEGKK